jgi:glycosyltransferase involved in cell wall biosynthesis
MTRLVWSAIVKNEAARIDRCISSLLPHIDGAVVVDTGSTDGTPDRILDLFKAADKPVELHFAGFENFSQARNIALQRARESKLDWDFLLLADADMELRVDRSDWINGHKGLSYDMLQVGGSLKYYNRRLLSRQATGWYQGVTHEYLDVGSSGVIDGAYFIDHADGYNRPDKFARDIALLEQALNTEKRPGLVERYHFYLAQSYYDAGQFDKAIGHYRKRVELGGFDEERWYAQMRLALCLRNMGDSAGFLWEMLAAYRMRPQRAETLYELAKFFRERGDNFNSLLFSETGMQVPFPKQDLLFVDDWTYKSGLKEEFSICAYYSERHRRTGAKEANRLALVGSEQARSNLFWYLQPLAEAVPSFKPQRISVLCDAGWVPMNPSVINHEGKPLILVRTVNYTITDEGQYRIRASDGSLAGDNPICTRNFIGSDAGDWREIALPSNWPDPKFHLVRGFEDSRLFQWRGEFYILSTVRELTHEGWCEQVLAPLVLSQQEVRVENKWRHILPEFRRHEKNWMPWVDGEELLFVYRLGTLINSKGETVFEEKLPWDVGHVSGGSQVVKIEAGRLQHWLAIVHEARQIPGRPNRYYQHRFVVFDNHKRVTRISPPFFFFDRQIEFAAGLAFIPSKMQLVVSFGVRDCEAWTVTMDPDDVIQFCYRDAL